MVEDLEVRFDPDGQDVYLFTIDELMEEDANARFNFY